MAKKKKTQLKPVARGFATTSVPKKVTQAEVLEAENGVSDAVVEEVKADLWKGKTAAAVVPTAPSDEFDPDKVEEQSLQNLVDKLQEKTEKEITRTVKAIEMDRRFSKTLPRLELDPLLVERIIAMVLDTPGEGKKTLDESEDKAVARLGITYGVLRRLGFSESRVEECLRAIQGVDLDEAYEWLYLHCPEEELEDKRVSESSEQPKTPRTPAHRSSRAPQTPRTPAEFMVPLTPTPKAKASRLDANAPTFVPSRFLQPPSLKEDESVTEEAEQAVLKAKIMSSFDRTSASESGGDSPVSDDPALQYAQTKLQLEKLSLNGHNGDAAQARDLRKRLTALKDSYFYDEKEAEAVYRVERDKANAAALQDRLRGNAPSLPQKPVSEKEGAKRRPPDLQPQVPTPSPTVTDIFDDDSDESVNGGVFEILDNIPDTETDAQGKTFTVRDMALPKHWSGRTPKTLLQETVAKVDRYAAIGYALISGPSRVKRASLSIRWEGRKMDEWVMEDIACHNEGQAEQYIATIALHALTFPETNGFAANASTASGSQTFFRLLPAVFRDLWGELEEARKIKDDATNRNLWAKLRSIVEPKLEGSTKVNRHFTV
ncbi:hypothetical protein DXG03_007133 [Asterophora parasitica]|uniref:ATP-dependent RNA helicase DHX29-like UBA domain-containing protein n=1 Tax=Asterophora parasitica TaxID=117018 RepID=A0A9P7GDL7_9AGAR|nr:hypothetical protein DXG03_007133 [Asterophora parasitica]